MPPRFLAQGAVDLVLGHRNGIGPSDLGEQEAEPDATLGDSAVLPLQLVVALTGLLGDLLLVLLARLLELLPDGLEFKVRHARRHREIVLGGELVEQSPLQALACETAILALELVANRLFQRLERLKAEV